MSSGLKEKLIILGGGLSLAALICGVGLLLKSRGASASTGPAPVEQSSHASGAKTTEKKPAHGTEQKAGEGAEKKATHGKTDSGHGASTAEPKHGAAEKSGHAASEGAGAEGGNEEVAAKPREHNTPSGEPDLWRAKGDAAMTCGRFDDAARHYALAAKKCLPEKKPEMELRLADATRQSPSLPQQLREQKALEIYTSILAEAPKSDAADHAQFQAANCMAAQTRWQEALDAFNRYEKNFPLGRHRDEVRFRRAEVLATLGNPDQAADILEDLIAQENDTARKSRAVLLLARVKLQMVRSESFGREHEQAAPAIPQEVIQPSTQSDQVMETSEGEAEPTDVAEAKTALDPNAPPKELISGVQWAAVKRCVEVGNLREAQRLVRPWLENNKDQAQRALLWARWANLLRSTAERGALDVPLEGILITSRAE